MSFLVDLYETLDKLKYSPNNYKSFLYHLNNIHGISAEQDDNPAIVLQLTKKMITFVDKHLYETRTDWYIEGSPLLYRTVKQLEAIAYLTGQVDEVLEVLNKYPLLKEIHHSIEHYREHCFLLGEQELAFTHFDRKVLTIQLLIRLVDAKFINQNNEQVCGVVGFLQALILFNPLIYIQTMANLAENGKYNLKQKKHHQNELKSEITEETVLMKPPHKPDSQDLADADHIGLVGLRSAMNLIALYSPGSAGWRKTLFGVTSSKEIKTWMKASGYHHCSILSLKKSKHITQLNYLIQDGYTVGLCITGELIDMLLGNIPPQEPNKLGQLKLLLSGHFVLLHNITYVAVTDKVIISFMTWGKEALNIEINYKTFKANSGLSEAIIGINDFAHTTLRTKNRDASDSLISPQAFCLLLEQTLPKEKSYKKLHQLINHARSHYKGISWFDAAKKLQDELSILSEQMALSSDIQLLQDKSIIPDNFNRMLRKFEDIEKYEQGPRKVNILKKLASEKNIEALCQLISLCFSKHFLDELPQLFLDDSYLSWQNIHDKSRALATLNDSCLEFIVKQSTLEELTRDAVLIHSLHAIGLLHDNVLYELKRCQMELSKKQMTPVAKETKASDNATNVMQTERPPIIDPVQPPNVTSNARLSIYSMLLLISSIIASIAWLSLNIAAGFGVSISLPVLTILAGPIGLAITSSLVLATIISASADYLYYSSNDIKPEVQGAPDKELTNAVEKSSLENPEQAQTTSRQARQRPALKRKNVRFFNAEPQSVTDATNNSEQPEPSRFTLKN
ncbi:hypothetical protein [uncultured Legionella sp.]|uniref:hypothetical protein n=1 Tax=uncultured Legionella sp. TaxID=210934 RepID=UPI0026374443|nr:hypothetical protein [uncultured Legionella sp.]